MEVLQALILGIVQGFAEWLPVSSQGMTSVVMVNFFSLTLSDAITYALWLHVGTLCAAIVYFWNDIVLLVKKTPSLLKKNKDKTLSFILIATTVSLALGSLLYFFVLDKLSFSGNAANAIIGLLLIITGVFQLKKQVKKRKDKQPNFLDAIYTGIAQSIAAFPGISRSGSTTSILLLRKFSSEQSLKLSFLLSIPITFASIIVVSLEGNISILSLSSLVSFVTAFVVGLVTIKYFMKLAKKISFGYFALIIGLLLISWFVVALFI